MIGYPRHFVAALWTVLIVLAVSGFLLVPGAFELRWEMDVPLQLPAGSRIAVAALHAFFAFATLAFLGSLYALHMRMGWRHRQNVTSGILSVSVFAALALTGLGIYYLANEALSRWTSLLHIALGVVLTGSLGVHYVLGRRIREARIARRHHHPHSADSGGLRNKRPVTLADAADLQRRHGT